jgi:hypothetical protein
MALLSDHLSSFLPCTWRGVPIQIYSYSITKGPLTKLHIGVFWKYPIVEDLGHAPTTIRISGFIDPDFVTLEKPILEAMIMAPGSGLLSIPSKGVIYAHCMSYESNEDTSNFVDVTLEFVQVKSPLGLLGDLLSGDLPDSIGSAIADAQSAIAGDIGGAVDSAVSAIGGIF